jgi:hypothetical protein
VALIVRSPITTPVPDPLRVVPEAATPDSAQEIAKASPLVPSEAAVRVTTLTPSLVAVVIVVIVVAAIAVVIALAIESVVAATVPSLVTVRVLPSTTTSKSSAGFEETVNVPVAADISVDAIGIRTCLPATAL